VAVRHNCQGTIHKVRRALDGGRGRSKKCGNYDRININMRGVWPCVTSHSMWCLQIAKKNHEILTNAKKFSSKKIESCAKSCEKGGRVNASCDERSAKYKNVSQEGGWRGRKWLRKRGGALCGT